MTVPHYLTLTRIFLIPIFMIVYLHGHHWFGLSAQVVPLLLMGIWAFSELTDAFDGYLARRLNQVTDLGKILDPMADSLSRLAIFFSFTQGVVALPLEVVMLMLYRDICISTLRTVCALKGFALAARRTGKIKAGIQAFVSFLILLLMCLQANGQCSLQQLQEWSSFLALFASLIVFFSGVDYVLANWHYVKKLIDTKDVS